MDEDYAIMLIRQLGSVNETLDEIAKELARINDTLSDLPPRLRKAAKTQDSSRKSREPKTGW